MRKIIFAAVAFSIVAFIAGCNFQDEGYTFLREWDGGTFHSKQGVITYFSASPDTAVSVHDVYMKVETRINYVNAADSIVMYGHCWGTSPDVKLRDDKDDGEGNTIPYSTRFYTSTYDDLQIGDKIESTLSPMEDETEYYIRSYVVTGKISGDNIIARDTAYNPAELVRATNAPQDLWEEKNLFAQGQPYLGAISFTYDDKMYVGLGHNEAVFDKKIYEYDPHNDLWSEFTSLPLAASEFSNAVAFVIENVQIGVETYRDYLYVGTGLTSEGTVTGEFWRYDFSTQQWIELRDGSMFTGADRQNAVAFTLGKKAYVALGSGSNGFPVDNVYEFDPEYNDVSGFYPQGRWTKMASFPGGKRTQAVAFVIGDDAYIACGQDENGIYKNDFWSMSITESGENAWARKRDFPGTPRIEAVGYNIETMGYIGTGLDASGLKTDYWRYNPFINDWDERHEYSGEARKEAVGAGLKYTDDDYRGYIGLGGGATVQDYFLDLWEYRP